MRSRSARSLPPRPNPLFRGVKFWVVTENALFVEGYASRRLQIGCDRRPCGYAIVQRDDACVTLGDYWHPAARVGLSSFRKRRESPGAVVMSTYALRSSPRKSRYSQRVARHVPCGELAMVRWISSESVRAPIFFIAVARWVSTVRWLMPRT